MREFSFLVTSATIGHSKNVSTTPTRVIPVESRRSTLSNQLWHYEISRAQGRLGATSYLHHYLSPNHDSSHSLHGNAARPRFSKWSRTPRMRRREGAAERRGNNSYRETCGDSVSFIEFLSMNCIQLNSKVEQRMSRLYIWT